MDAEQQKNDTSGPEYDPESFRSYVSIMRETLAVLDEDYDGPHGVDLPPKSLDDLQWRGLLERLSRHCASDQGQAIATQLPPLQHRESVERRLCEVEEVQRLISTDQAPPVRGLSPIGRFLHHVERGGVLDGEYLLEVASCARVAGEAKTYFRSRAHVAPLLAQVGDDLISTPELVNMIEKAFDPSGKLADHASPDLGALRRRVANYNDRLRRRVDGYLKSSDFQTFLQDDFYTLREDRYVLPIRAGEKGNVPGIVHGTSGSGQTIYIEPTELVEMNNELRLAQMEVQEEERRILARLSRMVAQHAGTLMANVDLLTYLDVTSAMGRVAIDLGANRPALSSEGAVDLREVRHPMLTYKSQESDKPFEVIANDIILGDTEKDGKRQRVLVISGPNTGGKTVTLKTLGLCSLMARAGLLLPARPGCVIPMFKGIFTDIGDEQSIERDLSTFSGHVTNITSFLARVDGESLVLLDELFTGTDPAQGAALATALLEYLGNRGAMVAVTTHLEGVKTLALKSTMFVNAAVGFNIDTLSPTYRLSMGLPGSSYAIRIARRLGLADTILTRAQELSEGLGQAEIETILQQLEKTQDRLDRELARARNSRQDARKLEQRLERELDKLRREQRAWVDEEVQAALDELNTARDAVRDVVKVLQSADNPDTITHDDVQASQKALDALEEKVGRHKDRRQREKVAQGRRQVRTEELQVGDKVFVLPFKRAGSVLELQNDGKVAVQIGSIRTSIGLDDIYVSPEGPERAAEQSATAKRPYGAGAAEQEGGVVVLPPQSPSNTVDLRGLRADESIERLELFLDAAYHADEPGVYVIHGHGTGALKRAVRAFLPSSRYVRSYRPGQQGEGGDGVTVAHLH